MISICIPVYNYDVIEFVEELHRQSVSLDRKVEIIVIEDGSDDIHVKKNSVITKISGLIHIHQKENKGRAATRNSLVKLAQFDKILFLDCDGMPLKDNFLQLYFDNYDKDIVCGGTKYGLKQNYQGSELRYKYGRIKEAKDADYRNKNPNNSFTTNNFLISKSIIEKIKFREFLKAYGHEDTILGFDLDKNNYKIYHINNPVVHLGVENNLVFIEKTQTAITNLVKIEASGIIEKHYLLKIRLLKTYSKFEKYRLVPLLVFLFNNFGGTIKTRLIKSKNPSIILFDIYKLLYFAMVNKQN